MTLKLTPERLAPVYEAIRAFPPFCHWGLPPGDTVEFKISKVQHHRGAYSAYKECKTPIIEISEKMVGHFDNLSLVMAHEMIHLYQDLRKSYTANAQHNAEFRVLAKQVCRAFGWDPKYFM